MPDAFATDAVAEAAPYDEAAAFASARVAAERQVEMLGRLAEVGLNLAIALEQQVLADAPVEDGLLGAKGDVGLTYSRIARAVRMTLALQARVLLEIPRLGRCETQERQGVERQQLQVRRGVIDAVVTRAISDTVDAEIEEQGEGADEAELDERIDRLLDALSERLDDEHAYGDILKRPISEVVAQICKDLGLKMEPDWDRWADHAWAVDEAATRAPGSPFVRRAMAATPSPSRGEGRDGGGPTAHAWKTCEAIPPPAPTLQG